MVTLLAIERAPKEFKVAVDVVGLADFIAYMSYKPEYRRQEVASEKGFGGKMPFDDLKEYLDVSPVDHVAGSRRRCSCWPPRAMRSRRSSCIPAD